MAIHPRNGRYGASVYIRGDRIWLGTFDTEDEAKFEELKAKRDRITKPETVADFATRYVDTYNRTTRGGKDRWAKKTKRHINYALKPLIAAFGPRRMRDLEPQHVRAWAQQQPYQYVSIANTMFSDAMRDGLIQRNPFQALRLERSKGRRDITVLTEEDIEKACEIARRSAGDYGPTLEAIIATAAYTAIRPGELAALEPSDVRVADCELDVRQAYNGVELKAPKNGKPRHGIVLPPQAGRRIEAMPRRLRSRWLFTSKKGVQLTSYIIERYWNPIRVAMERPDVDFYALRHAGATLLLERGASAEDVAWQLGHTDGGKLVRTLYGHPSDDGRRQRLKFVFDLSELRKREEPGEEAASG